jgi:hypothetical protein
MLSSEGAPKVLRQLIIPVNKLVGKFAPRVDERLSRAITITDPPCVLFGASFEAIKSSAEQDLKNDIFLPALRSGVI